MLGGIATPMSSHHLVNEYF